MSKQVKKYQRTNGRAMDSVLVSTLLDVTESDCAIWLAERMDTELGFTVEVKFTPEYIIITDVTKDSCDKLGGRYACEGKGILNREDNIFGHTLPYVGYKLYEAIKEVGDKNATFTIGGWKDITGYYIGNTILTNSKQNAEQYCKQEGEIAFWDIKESKECKVSNRGTLSDMAEIIRDSGVQKVEAFLNASIDAGDARPIEDFKAYAPQSCGTETQRRTVRQLFIRKVIEAAKSKMY